MVLRALPKANLINILLQSGAQRAWKASAQHFQQCQCILRRRAFGIVVEVNVHITVLVQPSVDPVRPILKRPIAVVGRVFTRVPVQTDVDQISRNPVPHRPVRRVGHTDGDGVLRHAFGYFVIEPRLVAKLDSMPRGFPMPQGL